MQVCIRRGSDQIGGSAVELISASSFRLVIDLGLPLDAQDNLASLLPSIKGLQQKTEDFLGILISHAHQDHYALGKHIDPEIPVYMGQEAADIMLVSEQHHLPGAFTFKKTEYFQNKVPFNIGPFTITPFLTDHSAYGSYSFLIEADGKRLFYSGDFRAHGRKSKLFKEMIQNPPEHIDVLLLEGSCLGRTGSETYETETSLEQKFSDVFKQTAGLVMIQTSAQNIDRLVTVYRAGKRNKRKMVLSGYSGHILQKLNNPHLPNFTWPDVKKFSLNQTARHIVTPETIAERPQEYVVLLGGKMFESLSSAGAVNRSAAFVYSLWDGYKKTYQTKIDQMKECGVALYDIHTSGHADIQTLKKFVNALHPAQVVPIHTFFPDRFKTLFSDVCLHGDNEVFEI